MDTGPAHDSPRHPQAQGQCATCQHCQRRGGTVLLATVGCLTFEDELPPRTAALVTFIALEWARSSACPACEPLVNKPDFHLALDLPTALAPARRP